MFRKGAYIVITFESRDSDLLQNYVFKQRRDNHHLSVEKDCAGRENGWSSITPDAKHLYRWATREEVDAYENVYHKPFDTVEFFKTRMVGLEIQALCDNPTGGQVKEGESGKVTSVTNSIFHVDFPSHSRVHYGVNVEKDLADIVHGRSKRYKVKWSHHHYIPLTPYIAWEPAVGDRITLIPGKHLNWNDTMNELAEMGGSYVIISGGDGSYSIKNFVTHERNFWTWDYKPNSKHFKKFVDIATVRMSTEEWVPKVGDVVEIIKPSLEINWVSQMDGYIGGRYTICYKNECKVNQTYQLENTVTGQHTPYSWEYSDRVKHFKKANQSTGIDEKIQEILYSKSSKSVPEISTSSDDELIQMFSQIVQVEKPLPKKEFILDLTPLQGELIDF